MVARVAKRAGKDLMIWSLARASSASVTSVSRMVFTSLRISATESALCGATNSPPAEKGPGVLRLSKLERAP